MILNARSFLLAGCLLLRALLSSAQPPPGYYDPAIGLTGDALKLALHDIIDNQAEHTYAQLWNDFHTTDVRDNGKVWDIYSDIPDGTPPYLYTFGSDQCGTYDSEGDCYNREHSVPQSWFNGMTPMYTDLHHIYPTDGWVNNKRGELPYGEVGSVDYTSQNGTRTGSSATPGYGGTVCEPRDEFKGDLARTYFYMMTRYAPQVASWSSPMFQGGDLMAWAENMLVQWSIDDPVSQKEIDRNNAVYALQNNRNPYIDQPSWVQNIWGPTAGIGEGALLATTRMWMDGSCIHVTNDRPGRGELRIVDGSGRTLRTAAMASGIASVDVSDLRGWMVAVLTVNEGSRVLPFVR